MPEKICTTRVWSSKRCNQTCKRLCSFPPSWLGTRGTEFHCWTPLTCYKLLNVAQNLYLWESGLLIQETWLNLAWQCSDPDFKTPDGKPQILHAGDYDFTMSHSESHNTPSTEDWMRLISHRYQNNNQTCVKLMQLLKLPWINVQQFVQL